MRILLYLGLLAAVLGAGGYVILTLVGEDPLEFARLRLEELNSDSPPPAAPAPPSGTNPPPAPATPTDNNPPQANPEPLWVSGTQNLGLRVRSSPAIHVDNILGNVAEGTRLSGMSGLQDADSFTWRQVQLEGWSAGDWLSPPPSIGVSVQVQGTGGTGLRVRSSPQVTAGNILGNAADGTRFQVIEGPRSAGGYQWWKLRLEGWMATRYLSDTPQAAQQPSAGPTRASVLNRIERTERVMAGSLPLPSADVLLPRVFAPEFVERSDQFYFLSQDYQTLSIRTLGFARSWVELGDYALAEEYIDRAFRYDRIRYAFYEASIEQLEASIDISQNLVIVVAGQTALGVTASLLGPGGVLAADLFDAYVDYSIARSVHGLPADQAAREELTALVVKQVFRLPTVKNALGDPVTEFVGKDSGLYQHLEGLIASPEVRAGIVQTVANSSADLLVDAASIDAAELANEVIDRLEKTVAGDLE